MSPTQPLPELSSDYSLTEANVADYRRDGHVTLRGLCSQEEIAALRPAVLAAVRRLNTESRPMDQRDTYGKAFLQTMNLWRQDEACARFTLSKRFARVAAKLMGVERVRLYHDQALFKEPGGGHTPWHQDQYYWPLDCKTVTLWMPLVNADSEMGTMHFASGSHDEGYLEAIGISDASEEFFASFVNERGYRVSPSGALMAGDATFHSGWVLHAAGGNKSDRTREAMTVIYLEDGAQILSPDNPNRENDLKSWFPGLNAGDPAASELNPLLYDDGKG